MIRFMVLSIAICGAAPLLAQAPQAAKPSNGAVKDPNRKICEEFKETGSRLAGRRICMSAAEWAAQRQDHRNDVEKAQKSIYVQNPG